MTQPRTNQAYDRQLFIRRMYNSHRAMIDLSTNATTKEYLGNVCHDPRLTKNLPIGDPRHPATDLFANPPSGYDIRLEKGDPEDYRDTPRPDIKGMKNKGGKLVRVGSSKKGYHKDFKEQVLPIIDRNFSKQELRDMNLYFEYPAGTAKSRWAGQCSHQTSRSGKKYAVISLRDQYRHDEEVVTHELVHARRYAKGEELRDKDRNEAETDLETAGRVSPGYFDKIACGYYQKIKRDPGITDCQLRTEDRVLLTGSKGRAMKGKKLVKAVKERYPKSNIARFGGGGDRKPGACAVNGCIPPALEWRDRYFTIRLPDGGTVEHHVQFVQKATLAQVRELLTDQFGQNIRVVEWHDGKGRVVLEPKKPAGRSPGRR